MIQTGLIGKNHTTQLNWLSDTWMQNGPPVCFLEGFPGTGKTTVARYLLEKVNATGTPTILITAPESSGDPTDDILLDLAMELSIVGQDNLASAVDDGHSLTKVLHKIIEAPILIIIDEFQRTMKGKSGRPGGGFAKVLTTMANRKWLNGRVLLLTNRLVERARWSEAYAIRRLQGMEINDGVQLLKQLLEETEQLNEIPDDRRHDVVAWLGGNPRAIRVLTASLMYDSLDELIGLNPELWETKDRYVSAELVGNLERELLERTLSQLSDEYNRYLNWLSVNRKPFKREATEIVFSDKTAASEFRRVIIDRFLMEQHFGWFNLHPIVREIGLQKLRQMQNEFFQAHGLASQYFTRHFSAKQVVGWGKLGGYFVEARYHLVNAKRADELGEIATRFENHIRSTINLVSPVPKDAEELDERIAVLSALLETPGAKGLEYHLARCFRARGRRNDLERAITHARRAIGPNAPDDTWVLCASLLVQSDRVSEAINLLKNGIELLSPQKSVKLYQSAGELLAQSGQTAEAIALLKDGIAKVPAGKNLFSLYQSAGELLAQSGQTAEAIALLKDGIAKVPANKNVYLLYTQCAYVLAQLGKLDEAIELLKDGILKIPVKNNLIALYISAANILGRSGKLYEVIMLLKNGISRLPIGTNQRYKLFEPLLNMLLAQQNIQTLDDLLSQASTLGMGEPQVAFGKVLRLMIMRDWEAAAKMAQQESANFPTYRPLLETGVFCWLCTENLNAAKNAYQRMNVVCKPGEKIMWINAWIALKSGDPNMAKDYISIYLKNAIEDQEIEVDEQFLVRLWGTIPTDFEQTNLAYYFPILPASLTGLPNDLICTQSKTIDIGQISSQKEFALKSQDVLIAQTIPTSSKSKGTDWPAWMDEVLNPSGNILRVDVGIVIALKEEFEALAPQIKTRSYYNPNIKQYYYLFERSSANHLIPYRCVVTFMGSMGPTDAGMVGDRLIAQFNPGTIVSIGIAGSMDKDVLVGDVVVADQTDEYLASSKAIETEDKQGWDFQFSGNPYKSDPTYVAHAMNLKFAHPEATRSWEEEGKQRLMEWIGSISTERLMRELLIREVPSIQTGHMASGPTVGAANQFVQWLKDRRDRKFVALEMESAGVLNAAHKRTISSLIIRGISDYSDDRKTKLDEIGEGALRRYAMNNALGLLWVLIDLRLINSID